MAQSWLLEVSVAVNTNITNLLVIVAAFGCCCLFTFVIRRRGLRFLPLCVHNKKTQSMGKRYLLTCWLEREAVCVLSRSQLLFFCVYKKVQLTRAWWCIPPSSSRVVNFNRREREREMGPPNGAITVTPGQPSHISLYAISHVTLHLSMTYHRRFFWSKSFIVKVSPITIRLLTL